MNLLLAFVYLGFLALVLGTALYLSVHYSSGKFDRTRVPDFVLTVSCATSLCFLPWADIVDTAWLVIYALAILCLRLSVIRRPFRAAEMVLHLAMLYLSLSRLDKVEGYGDPNQFLVVAQYIFFAAIVANCIYLILKSTKPLAIAALLLLLFPVSHFPLELVRNMVAREIAPNVSYLYVTKLYSREIYGLRFAKRDWVDHFSLIDGHFQKTDSSLLNDGGGTLNPQIPMISSWEWSLVKMSFDEQQQAEVWIHRYR
jgi:hypothetical protein